VIAVGGQQSVTAVNAENLMLVAGWHVKMVLATLRVGRYAIMVYGKNPIIVSLVGVKTAAVYLNA